MLAPWKKSYDQLRQHIKKQRHYFASKGPSSEGYGFFSSHVWVWELDYKESWVLKNWCFWTVVLEKTLESLLDCKEIQTVHPKGSSSWIFTVKYWYWSWNSNTLATWCEELTHWKRPWCWEKLKAGGEGDYSGWDCSMASLTGWTWVWVSSGSWWWTGKPGMLHSMGSQKIWLDWATELNWPERRILRKHFACMLSCFSHVWFFATPWTVAHQAPLFHVILRQEYWSALLYPSPGDLPHPWIKPESPAL